MDELIDTMVQELDNETTKVINMVDFMCFVFIQTLKKDK